MKKIYWLAACCLVAASFTACGDDEDEYEDGPTSGQTPGGDNENEDDGQSPDEDTNNPSGNTTPNTDDLGILFPVTSIMGYDISYFNYENGKLTNGYTDGAEFTITHNPLAAAISYENEYESYQEHYTNIRVNSDGFVTSADYSATDTYEEETEHYTGTAQMQYDSDGHITHNTITIHVGNYYEDNCAITYTWKNGNLTRIDIDDQEIEFGESSIYRESYEFIYDDDLSQNMNSGIYLYEMWLYTYDFMWYAGLFGKPTRNIPTAMRNTYSYTYSNGETSEYTYTYNINTEYNSDNSIARIEYRESGSSYAEREFTYGYDGIIPSAASALRSGSKDNHIRKGPAFLRRR